jgi:thiamine-monophosphate kinase
MISITLLGDIEPSKMVRRGGAMRGDIVFVSGTIGDAALGLLLKNRDQRLTSLSLSKAHKKHLTERYLYPQPRVSLAPLISRHATAAMDISDGLVGDFRKLCACSGVGGVIEAHQVPLSDAATRALASTPGLLETVLVGGDDYEVLATVPPEQAAEFEREAKIVRPIGKILRERDGIVVVAEDGQPIELAQSAYDHFSARKDEGSGRRET